jgi:hypothetical protein
MLASAFNCLPHPPHRAFLVFGGADVTNQGCQMLYFQTQNPNYGKFWRALEWKMMAYFMVIWNILCPFGIVYKPGLPDGIFSDPKSQCG